MPVTKNTLRPYLLIYVRKVHDSVKRDNEIMDVYSIDWSFLVIFGKEIVTER